MEVAALEHITKAAARLNMTQSAVSAAVTSLEARHGVTLFDRVGRSVVLNHTGRLFLKQALAVLASAKAAEAALMDLSGLMHGELSIMASQTIGSYWLPAKLAAYRTRYPGIRLDVRIGNTAEVADAVSLGEVEVGLIEWPTEKRGVTARQVAVDTMIIVVAPGHPWAGTGKSIGEFQGTPWVLREPGSGTRLAFENMLHEKRADAKMIDIALVLPSNEAVIRAVEAGLGATLVSRSVAASLLHSGLLAEVKATSAPRPFFLLRHEERYRSKAADALEALIAEGQS